MTPTSPIPISTLARVQLVIGHIAVIVGWVTMLVASLAFWGLVMQSDLVTAMEFDAELATTEATIQRIGVHGRRGPDVFVDFTYEVAGQRFEQRSYAASREAVPAAPVAEYIVANPSRARLDGLDARPMRGGRLFLIGVIAGATFALICLIAGVVAGVRNRQFFLRARLTVGRVVDRKASSPDSRVLALELEYADAVHADSGGPWRTHVVVSREAARVTSGDVPMLYDPARPARVMMLDQLECGVRYREHRGIVAGGGWLVAGILAPLACIAANVVAIAWSMP